MSSRLLIFSLLEIAKQIGKQVFHLSLLLVRERPLSESAEQQTARQNNCQQSLTPRLRPFQRANWRSSE